MRYLYGLIAGLAAGVGTVYLSAVLLAVFNLYLTGHGITWPDKEFNWRFISMSFLDLVFLVLIFIAFVATMIAVVRMAGRRS